MTHVVEVSPEQLRADRKDLLARSHMTWEDMVQLADAYALSAEERNIYDSIRGIDFLLGDDEH